MENESVVEEIALKIQCAKVEVENEIKEEEKKVKWYVKLGRFLFFIAKTLVSVVLNGVKDEVTFIINNAENQQLAKIAILTAVKMGLKSNAAWAAAYAVLQAGEIVISKNKRIKASEIATNIKETLLQLMYCCYKNQIEK